MSNEKIKTQIHTLIRLLFVLAGKKVVWINGKNSDDGYIMGMDQ